MASSAPVRRPAVLPALALITGIALAPEPLLRAAGLPWLVLAGLLAAALARRGSPRRARAWLCLAALSGGTALEIRDRREWTAATAGILDPEGAPREMHFRGELLAAPEADWTGDRLLSLRGQPEAPTPKAPRRLVVVLRVTPRNETEAADLDRLGAGDVLRVWCRLRRPAAPGDRYVHDPRLALRAAGVDGLGAVKSARLIERVDAAPPWRLDVLVGRVKCLARRRLDALFRDDPTSRALAGAMLLGDRQALTPEDQRLLRDAGLIHVVSISGLHIALIAWWLGAAIDRGVRQRWVRLGLLGSALSAFTLLVGAQSCVQRAVIGALLLRCGASLGREGDPVNSLAVVAAVLLAWAPASVRDPAFQLTFTATAGILILARRLSESIPWPRPLADAAAVGLAAHVATAPLVAWHFGRQTAVALITNLAVGPLCATLLVGSFLGIAFREVPVVGTAFGRLGSASCGSLMSLGGMARAWEPGSGTVAPPSGLALALYCGCLMAGARTGPNRRRMGSLLARGAAALGAVWLHLGPPPPPPGLAPEAAVIDVGQGLAVALRGPIGDVVLIDAGGSADPRFDPGERLVVPFLSRWGATRRLEALVLTHDDTDHCGGAFAILRDLEVGELWLGPGSASSPRFSALAAMARERGTAIVLVERGHRLQPAGLHVEVLAPDRRRLAPTSNDRSIVLRVGEAPSRILVPGDLEAAGERLLLDAAAPLRAEALVLGHHGSNSSSTRAFLARVDPRRVVVSCGRFNPFGHPHAEVLGRLERLELVPLRTDELGSVGLRAGPRGWRTSPEINPLRTKPARR